MNTRVAYAYICTALIFIGAWFPEETCRCEVPGHWECKSSSCANEARAHSKEFKHAIICKDTSWAFTTLNALRSFLFPYLAFESERSASLRQAVERLNVTQKDRVEASRLMEAEGFKCVAWVQAWVPLEEQHPRYVDCKRRTVAAARCIAQRVRLQVSVDDRTIDSIFSVQESACQ